jgi:hypothetical protein
MSKTFLLRRTQVWRRTALVGVLALLLLRAPALTDAGGAVLESGAAVETPAVQQPPFRRALGLHGDDGRAGRRRCARALTRLAVQATDMPGGVGAQEVEKTV